MSTLNKLPDCESYGRVLLQRQARIKRAKSYYRKPDIVEMFYLGL